MPANSRRSFTVFLANPPPAAERIGFSFITPRARPVLAAVTPREPFVERLRVIDQTIYAYWLDPGHPRGGRAPCPLGGGEPLSRHPRTLPSRR